MYLAARNAEKVNETIARLKAAGIGSGEVIAHKLDLANPHDAKASAEEFLKREDRLNLLGQCLWMQSQNLMK